VVEVSRLRLNSCDPLGTDLDFPEVGYETRALLSSSDDGERLDVVARESHATPRG
jgi:hypothetical protein